MKKYKKNINILLEYLKKNEIKNDRRIDLSHLRCFNFHYLNNNNDDSSLDKVESENKRK